MELEELVRTSDEILKGSSRSFYLPIKQIMISGDKELGVEVMTFYNLCRALDTIEDSALERPQKKKLLKDFSEQLGSDNLNILSQNDLVVDQVVEAREDPGYAHLMHNLENVHDLYLNLEEDSQQIIKNVIIEMSEGMSEFIGKDIRDNKDLDDYIYHVAGIVGRGYAKLLERRGFLKEGDHDDKALAYGRVLQKVNILKNISEDSEQGRFYIPEDMLQEGGVEGRPTQLGQGILEQYIDSVARDIPDAMDCVDAVNQRSIRIATAFPLVMAVKTLALYKNAGQTGENLKISKLDVLGAYAKLLFNGASRNYLNKVYESSGLMKSLS